MHKPIYRYDIEQNSDEWFEIKLGKFSASICPELLMDKSSHLCLRNPGVPIGPIPHSLQFGVSGTQAVPVCLRTGCGI